jgi:hypothetical protein
MQRRHALGATGLPEWSQLVLCFEAQGIHFHWLMLLPVITWVFAWPYQKGGGITLEDCFCHLGISLWNEGNFDCIRGLTEKQRYINFKIIYKIQVARAIHQI